MQKCTSDLLSLVNRQFDGLELTIYEAQGHVQLSAKAQGIMLAKKT